MRKVYIGAASSLVSISRVVSGIGATAVLHRGNPFHYPTGLQRHPQSCNTSRWNDALELSRSGSL